MIVRMLHQVSGGRNGVPWPPAGVTIEVPDNEGLDLIRAEVAVAGGENAKEIMDTLAGHQVPGRSSKLDPREVRQQAAQIEEQAAQLGDLAAEAGDPAASAAEPPGELLSLAPDVAGQDEAGGAGNAAEGAAEPSPVAEAPGPSAPKQAWIDFAIRTGADPDTAAAMTKADLMSRYGGRL